MSLSVDIEKELGAFHLSVHFKTKGGIVGLLGASGSGKSKTLQCIAGIERPDAGRIVLNDRVLFDTAAHIDCPVQKRHVGYLFQSYALFPTMTVEENIACGVHYLKDKAERTRRVRAMLERLRLTGLEKHKPAELSGGQQQRTALARCLVGEPEILLLDEPFSALDTWLREELLAELHDLLIDYDRDVILVTHNREEAYGLCRDMAILDAGHLDAYGPVKEIFASPSTQAGAMLTGCKNIVPAHRCGPAEVAVPDWGLTFDAGRPVGEALCAIAIRPQAFVPESSENSQDIIIEQVTEQPFSSLIRFCFVRQKEGTRPVWWRLERASAAPGPARLGVAPQDILLLYH